MLIDKVCVEAILLVLGSAQWFVDVFLLLFELSSGLGGLLDSLVRIIDGFMLAESSSFPEESRALFEGFDHELALIHWLDLLRHGLLFLYQIILEIVFALLSLLLFTIRL